MICRCRRYFCLFIVFEWEWERTYRTYTDLQNNVAINDWK